MGVIFGDSFGFVLDQEQVNFYNQNGYLVVEGVFSKEECAAMLREFEQHADADFSAILNLDRRVPAIRNIMRKGRIVEILEQLQKREVVGLMSQVLFKKAASKYAPQAWNPHQDNAYPQAAAGAYITINIFLEDADRENGFMYIYPGSHKEGLLRFKPTVSYREAQGTNPGNTVEVPECYTKQDLVVKKGDMLVLHGDVIHGSYPNLSPTRSRPLFSISYISKGELFIPGRNANRMEIPLRPLVD